MSQTRKVSGTATRVYQDGAETVVRYHATDVVRFTATTVTLNSGGWHTSTTKRRLMQASNEYNLGYDVWQKDFAWYVSYCDESGATITRDFEDGMTLPRRARYWDAGRGWRYAGSDA